MTEESIRIPVPDDWHLHLRDGEVLELTANHSAARCKRAIIMPNLKPPVVTIEDAQSYLERIRKALGPSSFQPLMTLYLTDRTDAAQIKKAVQSDHVFAVKLYPAGATTNSEHGLTSIQKAEEALAAMEAEGFPLLVHAEATDPSIDVFDREKAFVDGDLDWICQRFPGLRIVFEHVSSRHGVEFVRSESRRMGATVTPHHLLLTRNDLLVGGLKPHHYCLPVVKTEEDRQSLIDACLTLENFFAGTDSAPHPRSKKESHSCAAGIYTAPFFPELYTMAFEHRFAAGERDRNSLKPMEGFLRDFLCLRGERFYGLKSSGEQHMEIRREVQLIPEHYPFGDDVLIPLYAGKTIPYTAEIIGAHS